ncbi:MAG: hypothetical protein LKH27_08165 [Prevotella sp.]|jgi:hypothetical protein|nr:hypothetical protein [Prevotella sp.]MCH3993027.1 hypothetical protein [Prevotella sp.]MCI1474372.1 hypothetical protein [Prevotella sp.]MCI1596072.1 hypothetical protein [Prevotella sp.]
MIHFISVKDDDTGKIVDLDMMEDEYKFELRLIEKKAKYNCGRYTIDTRIL